MSFGVGRSVRFYQAAIGKKAVMAVTGCILFGYVLAHLIWETSRSIVGRAQINRYAELLHSQPALLWVARIVLLTAVGFHIVTAIQLWLLKRKARPVDYVRYSHVPPGYASRTMLWTGPLIAAYVVYHVLHLTLGRCRPALPGARRLRQRRGRLPGSCRSRSPTSPP